MLNSFLSFSSSWDRLAIIMMTLVVFIGLCIGSFATRYMRGDIKYRAFFTQLILLIVSVCIMVSTDNLFIFLIAWCLNNILLVRLMIHKSSWKAAKASGIMAAKNYCLGACFLISAFIIFYSVTGELSIHKILLESTQSMSITIALVLILIAAMTQSAIWPFHRWLISSLNSPTPVSAIMHAGLINGGGFLLVRFAPLYLQNSTLLTVIFAIGFITAILGTLWKLMQNDVKRMLACSTMAQMGFMVAQCGLGLFPAAIVHLVWHGMFKAYLFLASGSAAQEKRLDLGYPPKLSTLICALLGGLTGSLSFGYVTGKSWLTGDTTLVLMVATFIAASQFALTILQVNPLKRIFLTFISTAIVGLFYGFSIQIISWILEPMRLMQPQILNIFHIMGIITLMLAWLAILFLRNVAKPANFPSWILKCYVATLNASQPHCDTITAHRNHYQY